MQIMGCLSFVQVLAVNQKTKQGSTPYDSLFDKNHDRELRKVFVKEFCKVVSMIRLANLCVNTKSASRLSPPPLWEIMPPPSKLESNNNSSRRWRSRLSVVQRRLRGRHRRHSQMENSRLRQLTLWPPSSTVRFFRLLDIKTPNGQGVVFNGSF